MKETLLMLNKDLQTLDMHTNHWGHNVSIISQPYYCTECEVYLQGLVWEEGDSGTDDSL